MTLERAAERCINVLLDLIKQKVNYVVQEAVVVITDIFRRYPNRCCPGGIALQVGCSVSSNASVHSSRRTSSLRECIYFMQGSCWKMQRSCFSLALA